MGKINKISPKQKEENTRRRFYHYKLWVDQEGKCAKCGRVLTYAQSELSHKKPLARGGKTTSENCEVVCNSYISDCHSTEHRQRTFHNEQPQWSK